MNAKYCSQNLKGREHFGEVSTDERIYENGSYTNGA
jgi:hypothetical protein